MNILIVDDDLDDLEFFLEAVSEISRNIHCLTACNGLEALKLLDQADIKPSYIFLDLNMPKMGGKQCLRYIKNNPILNSIPVIIYSTSSREEDIEECKQIGAYSFIVKPNKFDLLKAEIQNVLHTG